ncbi:MAG: [protein-PII] uridylyltransferase [Planctomycetota bacterium]|nr:[protein-PII] uridylyltransferase [Planctomycetota bacterium]MDA1177934.1 [protein-PII] uridylyltransferase [Planctomycetota bacterium]
MLTTPGLREAVVAAREQLALGRQKLRLQHDRGSPGIQLCSSWSQRLEDVSILLFEDALQAMERQMSNLSWRSRVTLVVHGGFGRRDTAPYSDLDIMLLFSPELNQHLPALARRLQQDFSDLAEDIGFCVRTPREACKLASQDPVVYSSLVEARRIAGNERLFARFQQRFRRTVSWRAKRIVKRVEQARRIERTRYGDTVNLLQPNIKRSPGGLRDLHLLRWIGFARYGAADLETLRRQGQLSALDYRRLRDAWEFLLRLRNEMHFHAGRSQDLLSRAEQLRISERFGFVGDEGVLAVERFMQQYFHHSSNIRDIVSHFAASACQPAAYNRFMAPLYGHFMEGDFLVAPGQIAVRPRSLQRVRGDLFEVLRLMDLANRYDKLIEHRSWEAIRAKMMEQPVNELSTAAKERFMSLLSQIPRLGDLLRRLHELRALERIIPSFAHARCLLQFNEYHKYTVDEHSIRAVEAATQFQDDPGYLGECYRKVRNKQLLHLALLIHDLGKGFAEDHSDVGRRIAVDVAKRLGLSEEDSESLEFLVYRHLYLAHLAFHRDTSDESAIVRAAVDIGSPDLLRMLFVLTCADYAAVGPGVLNTWKIDLLSDLYRRIRTHLTVEEPSDRNARGRHELRDTIAKSFAGDAHADWYLQQLELIPSSFLRLVSLENIVEDLKHLRLLEDNHVQAWGRFDRSRGVSEYTIAAREGITDGIFHRLTGALTAKRLQILSAELIALDDKRFLDRFVVEDPDFGDEPHPSRFQEIRDALKSALMSSTEVPPAFRQTWKGSSLASPAVVSRHITDVQIDNATSDRFTIFEVFAHDSPGLLYRIARALHDNGLSVSHAKISTYVDQVVDVFYVTGRNNQKIADAEILHTIRESLLQAVQACNTDSQGE